MRCNGKQAIWGAVATLVGGAAFGACVIPEETKQRDPVEVGYCESDAVFIGEVVGRIETVRAFRPEGSDVTKHFNTQRSTVRVLTRFKGELPDKVTMVAELYDKEGAYRFEPGKKYLIFAKHLNGDEYAGAAAACSVQPTLPLEQADALVKRLKKEKKRLSALTCK